MSTPDLKVIEGVEFDGHVNTSDEELIANIRAAMKRGHPQVKRQEPKFERVALVGSGPSLAHTEKELVALIQEGAKLVTVNGAYHWCLERNLKPSAQVVMDARPGNERFVQPDVPGCTYLVASQCHPKMFDAVEGRPNVWIFHAMNAQNQGREILDEYYLGHCHAVPGGSTVTMRALVALRMLGYLRFDLFGIDSCMMNGAHHAIEQPENNNDRWLKIRVGPTGHSEMRREFIATPWHCKQLEDFLQFMRLNGELVLLNVHGDGLIAYALQCNADVAIDEVE